MKFNPFAFAALITLAARIFPLTSDDIRNMPVNSWLSVPNSNLSAVDPCPAGNCAYSGVEGVMGVHSYSGAVMDSKRNRLVVWGGGHNAYYGNEIYAFDVNDLKWSRLTNPSLNWNNGGDVNADGSANTRHTYNGLAYIAHADRFFALGGAPAATSGGCGMQATWTFDFTLNKWFNMNPSGSSLPGPECNDMAVYDPISKKTFWGEDHIGGGTQSMGLWSYDYDKNLWAHHYSNVGYTSCIGIVDTKRKLLVIIGNPPYVGVHVYDIGNNALATPQTWNTTGGSGFVSAYFKGLSYDPVADRYVGVDGNNTVWALNPDTKVWTAYSPAGTGPDQSHLAGIYGLWQYAPSVNAYIFQTHAKKDVYFYKFSGGTGAEAKAEAKVEERMSVSPNPFTSVLSIHCPGAGARVSVFDAAGRSVARWKGVKGGEITWRPGQLPRGIYLVRAESKGTAVTHPVILR